MVAVAILVGLFTCGLGLLLLFLAQKQVTKTAWMEQITVTGPKLYYVTPPTQGGREFVSWLKLQQASLSETLKNQNDHVE
jgi:hypothetical protein